MVPLASPPYGSVNRPPTVIDNTYVYHNMKFHVCEHLFYKKHRPVCSGAVFRLMLFLRRLVADHERLHIRVDGMRRNAVRDGCFYGIQGDDPRDARDDAEGDDVGKE